MWKYCSRQLPPAPPPCTSIARRVQLFWQPTLTPGSRHSNLHETRCSGSGSVGDRGHGQLQPDTLRQALVGSTLYTDHGTAHSRSKHALFLQPRADQLGLMEKRWSGQSSNYAPRPPDSQQLTAQQASSAFGTSPVPSPLTSSVASLTIASAPQKMDYEGDMDGDLVMHDQDADNPYNSNKYAKPRTNSRLSQYVPNEQQDVASRTARYSPMNTSPTSTYVSSPTQQQQPASQYTSYTPQQSARQSPSRQNPYTSPRYYASPLPPIQSNFSPTQYPQSATQALNTIFSHEPQSPSLQQQQQQTTAPTRTGVPQFTKCNGTESLVPRVNTQPPFRRANPEGGFISPLQALTTHLPSTYRICNPTFQYESSRNPRRVLTKPSKGVKNDGYDNEDSDYILYVNDILGSEETNHKNRYLILDVLGQGTFGQVVKCQNLKTQEVVAVKVVKNKTAYFNQSMMEVSVLDLLNGRMDKNDDHHILRLKDTFIHRQHLCLVFELLSVNLYELIKQNQFRGLSTTLVRVFAQQLLNGLCLLSKAKLIHCDLKPENILLKK